ncbi:MAG: alpha/beta fold hydrolase [Phycisphaeraceae bacterium]
MQISQWRAMGRYTRFGSRRVFHIDRGSGEPLLLLHAYPTASWGWYELLPRLVSRFRVIIPDLVGSGFSDKPADDAAYSVFRLADQVETLLEELEVDEVRVFAHAYGSTTAQELLARHADRRERGEAGGLEIRSVSFTNAGLFPEATRPTATQKFMLTPCGGWLTRQVPAPLGMFKRKLRPNFGTLRPPTEAMLRSIWELLRYNGGHRVASRVLGYLKERPQYRDRWVGAMLRTRVPLQLINGAADPVAGEGVPRVWKKLLPDSPLVELDPGVGHYPPLEAPEELLEHFLTFVNSSARRIEEPALRGE